MLLAEQALWMEILSLTLPAVVVAILFFIHRKYDRDAERRARDHERDMEAKQLLRENYSEWFEAASHAVTAIDHEKIAEVMDKLEAKVAEHANKPHDDLSTRHAKILQASQEAGIAMQSVAACATKLRLVDTNPQREGMVKAVLDELYRLRQAEEMATDSSVHSLMQKPIDHLIESRDAR